MGYEKRIDSLEIDLMLHEVSDLTSGQFQISAQQFSLAEAERRDLADMATELRSENSRLMEAVKLTDGPKLTASLKKMGAESGAALQALGDQARRQKEQLEELREAGVEQASELSAKLDSIALIAAAAAAANAADKAPQAVAKAEELFVQHKECSEKLAFLISVSGNAAAAHAADNMRKTENAMQDTQKALAAVIESNRHAQEEAFKEVVAKGSAAAAKAAKEMLENMGGLKEMHTQQCSLMKEIAKDLAGLKKTVDKIAADLSGVGVDVKSLLALTQMMQKMLAAAPAAADPAVRHAKLLSALKACASDMAGVDANMQSVFNSGSSPPGAELQEALKPVQRMVVLTRLAAASLEAKVRMLSPAQTPPAAIEDLTSALKACCGDVSAKTPAERVTAMQPQLRFALSALAEANRSAEMSLEGNGAVASKEVPAGWARALWDLAFTAWGYSGPLSALKSAKASYTGPPVDELRFAQFVSLKGQDAALGAADRVDVFEWAAMANALSAASVVAKPASGLEGQRLLDRLVAYANANKSDPDFRVLVHLKGKPIPPRGMQATATKFTARMGDSVTLEVTATKDCYFYLIEQDSTGDVSPLVPWNEAVSGIDNKLTANVIRPVPAADGSDGFNIQFVPPAGLERVVVFAVQRKLEEWDMATVATRGAALSRAFMCTATNPTQHAGGVATATLVFDLV